MGKAFWMPKDAGRINDGAEMVYNNSSRMEPKRPHQWFLDATEPELFPNKRQAIETSGNRLLSGIPNPHFSPWENVSSFQSSQYAGRLFGTEPTRNMNFGSRNIPSMGADNLNLGRPGIDDHFGADPSIALSMSHTMEDPGSCLSYGGIRKVKINQVKDSDNCMSVSMGNLTSLNKGDPNTIFFNQVRDMSLPINQVHTFDKGDNSTISFNHVKDSDNSMSMSTGHTYKGESNTISFSQGKNLDSEIPLSIGHTFTKGASNTISFSGFHEESETNPSGRLIGNYDLVMNQSSVQSGDLSTEVFVSTAEAANNMVDTVPKNKSSEPKMSKKMPPNNFPSNVRSLLSTGILDGVAVKYVSWSRESNGFLQVLNAYEFERHAGCKTKHPNNHIFFVNGKTIYGIVQELRSTPQHLLFEAIQTVTGSQINRKAFLSWKESFQAATRELQRIYGKDELSKLSQLGNT
ncbi:hypothetical protein GIB67_037544 [Kingdonia uniflora]|uniref:Tify domain-containing protein n=1 Tax=Kingdonia uniflora TaxID=39325 RepID=A0A7J7NB65_9MAGN|nr:hypothetical protein GIB67_037544 [Kingdonia uniflora]